MKKRLIILFAVIALAWILSALGIVQKSGLKTVGLILIVFGFAISFLLGSRLEKAGPGVISTGILLIIIGAAFILM